MLGRISRASPQFISSSDGSWFGTSACIERMTQMSSITLPTLAKNSLTSMPLWPYFWNLNGEGNAAPVLRSVRQVGSRQRLAVRTRRAGLGVERIDVRAAAVSEDVDDVLRLGGKVRLLGRERRDVARRRLCGRLLDQASLLHQVGQRQRAETHAAAREHLAAGDRTRIDMGDHG